MRRLPVAVAVLVLSVAVAWAAGPTVPLPPSIAPGGVYNPNSEEVPLPPSVAPGGVYNPSAGNIPLPSSIAPGGVFNPNAVQMPLPPSVAPGGVFNPNATKMPLSSAVAPGGVFNPNSTVLPLPQSIAPGGVYLPNAGAIALPPSIAPGGVFNPDSTKMPLSSAVAPGGVFDQGLTVIPQSADIAAAVANNLQQQGFVPLPNQINVIPPGGMPLTSGDLTNPSHTTGALVFYTLGDTDLYMAALNAVAMMFSATSTSGLYGTTTVNGTTFDFLGPIAAIGMLFSLLFICISGIMKQELRLDQMLVTLILSYAMFVPKTTVVIEDIYSGSVKSVDNVPYGVAVPGALISMFTFNFAKQIETAFTATSAVQPLVTASANGTSIGGFANPLKMLLALQTINVCGSNGDICADMVEYTRSCLSDSQGNKILADKVFKNPDLLTELFGPSGGGKGIQASVIYRSAYHQGAVGSLNTPALLADGGIVACDQAASAIRNDIETYLSNPAGLASNSFASDFAHAMGQRKIGSLTGAVPGVNDGGGYEWKTQLNDTLAATALLGQAGVAGTTTDARSWIATMIMRNPTFSAYAAANQSDRAAAYDVYMTVAMEQFKADAAADGSMFLKTMLPSMTVLTFFFFAFAPIVALLVMVTGLQAIKILTSYVIFGFWTQSWLPGAAIVNYFIQQQWLSKVTGTGSGIPGGMFAIANQPELYDIASTQLAVGANMLASVPVVMMALITGSAYGLSHLADKMGASRKGYFDEKGLVPDAMTATNASAVMKRDMDMGYAYKPGDRPSPLMPAEAQALPNFNYSATDSGSTAASQALSTKSAAGESAAVNKLGQAQRNTSKGIDWGTSVKDTHSSTLTDQVKAEINKTFGTGTSNKFGSKIDDATRVALAAGASALAQGLSLPLAKTAATAALAMQLKALGLDASNAHAVTTSLDNAFDASLKNNFTTGDGINRQKADQFARSTEAAIKKTYGEQSSVTDAYQAVKNTSVEQAKMDQATKTRQMSEQGGATINASGLNMVNSFETGYRDSGTRSNKMAPAVKALNERADSLSAVTSPEAKAGIAAINTYASAGNLRGVLDEANKLTLSPNATTAALGHYAVGFFGATKNAEGNQIGPSGLPEAALRTGKHLEAMDASVREIERATGGTLGSAPGANPDSELGQKGAKIEDTVKTQQAALEGRVQAGKNTGTAAYKREEGVVAGGFTANDTAVNNARTDVNDKGVEAFNAQSRTNEKNSSAGAGPAAAVFGIGTDALAAGNLAATSAIGRTRAAATEALENLKAKAGGGPAATPPGATPPADPAGAPKAPGATAAPGATPPAATPPTAPGAYAQATPPAAEPAAPAPVGESPPFPKSAGAQAVQAAYPSAPAQPAAANTTLPPAGEAPKVEVPDSMKTAGAPSTAGGAASGGASAVGNFLKGPAPWWAASAALEAHHVSQQAPFLDNNWDKAQLSIESGAKGVAAMWAGGEAGVYATIAAVPLMGPFAPVAGVIAAAAVGTTAYKGVGWIETGVAHALGTKTGDEKANENRVSQGVFPAGTQAPDSATLQRLRDNQPQPDTSAPSTAPRAATR